MTRALLKARIPAFKARPFDIDKALKELDMFYQGRDPVHQTMHRIVKKLEKAKIPYAVVGGMAVFAHKYRRATNDVDILVTREGFEQFRKLIAPRDYRKSPQRPRRFIDRLNTVTIGFLLTGFFPGSGQPGPIAYPDPADVKQAIKKVQYADLPTLIQLKLAARRHRDFGDVVELIRFNNLDESFLSELHPSVHRDYIECLEEKRREDEYEARQDRAVQQELRKHGKRGEE